MEGRETMSDDQLELGHSPPPREQLCRDAADTAKPCEYAGICHDTRQRLMHYASPQPLRGMECWAYQGLRARAARTGRAVQAAGSSTVADENPAT